jgi:hypothetical protein
VLPRVGRAGGQILELIVLVDRAERIGDVQTKSAVGECGKSHTSGVLRHRGRLFWMQRHRGPRLKGETLTLQINKVIRLQKIGGICKTTRKNRDWPEHESLLRHMASIRINVTLGDNRTRSVPQAPLMSRYLSGNRAHKADRVPVQPTPPPPSDRAGVGTTGRRLPVSLRKPRSEHDCT